MDAGRMSNGTISHGGAGLTMTNEHDPQSEQTQAGNPPAGDATSPPETPIPNAEAGSQPDSGGQSTPEGAIQDAQDAVGRMREEVDAAVPVSLHDFERDSGSDSSAGIGMLGDVDLDVRIELGRTQMLVEDVLKLNPESVVELDKAAGDPVDIYVNGRHVARGEVLVLNENFCVRVSEIIGKIPTAADPD